MCQATTDIIASENAKQFARDTREFREKIIDDKGWEKFNDHGIYRLAMALIVAQLITSAIIIALATFGHGVAVTSLGGVNDATVTTVFLSNE